VLAGVLLALALTLQLPTAPTARVNDYADLLTLDERQRLESDLAGREQATGTQMAIAIFRSLADLRLPDGTTPATIEELSIRLAEKWRIGQKGLDNGIILVVLVDDRKLRFEVGYGLEPVIPDIVAGGIIREAIAPHFRERRYAAGLAAAVQEVYRRIEAGPQKAAARKPEGFAWPVSGFLFLIVIVAIMLSMEASRSRRFVGRRGYTAGRRGWMGPVIFPGGFGGGGGGWSSGGGSGGGFSGGGGSFGGGGASGSW